MGTVCVCVCVCVCACVCVCVHDDERTFVRITIAHILRIRNRIHNITAHQNGIVNERRAVVCLSVYLSVCLSVCLSVYLSARLSVYVSICLSVYLSVCLSVYLSVCLSVYLSIYLSVYQDSMIETPRRTYPSAVKEISAALSTSRFHRVPSPPAAPSTLPPPSARQSNVNVSLRDNTPDHASPKIPVPMTPAGNDVCVYVCV